MGRAESQPLPQDTFIVKHKEKRVTAETRPVLYDQEEQRRAIEKSDKQHENLDYLQVLEASKHEDALSSALISEYMKSGDARSANELIKRANIERRMRGAETFELARIRDRKDVDLTFAESIEREMEEIPQDGTEENLLAREEKYQKAMLARTLKNEVSKISLTGDGVETGMEGVFKPADGESHVFAENMDIGTATNHKPRGHLREWLAGMVAKSLGVEKVVPPTVIREVDGRVGSVQAWVEGDLAITKLNWQEEVKQEDLQQIALLDFVLDNFDRHESNFLINESGNAFAIDHGFILPLKKGAGLRSFPLRVLSEQPISPDIVSRMNAFIASEPRMKAIEDAFTFVLGEEAPPKFEGLKARVRELKDKQKFPNYVLPFAEEEASYVSSEGARTEGAPAQTEIGRTQVKSLLG